MTRWTDAVRLHANSHIKETIAIMPIALSCCFVLFFLLMNAFFVAAEFSLVRVRKSQVEILVDEGRKGAKYTKLVADNVNAYLSACQLGITLASLALGWLGEPAVSALFEPLFKHSTCPRRPRTASPSSSVSSSSPRCTSWWASSSRSRWPSSPPSATPCSRPRRSCGSTASRTPSCGCSTALRTAS